MHYFYVILYVSWCFYFALVLYCMLVMLCDVPLLLLKPLLLIDNRSIESLLTSIPFRYTTLKYTFPLKNKVTHTKTRTTSDRHLKNERINKK